MCECVVSVCTHLGVLAGCQSKHCLLLISYGVLLHMQRLGGLAHLHVELRVGGDGLSLVDRTIHHLKH